MHEASKTLVVAPSPSQQAVLDGLWKLVRGWFPDAHEGPGALVDERVWTSAVRRLADHLLGSAGLPDRHGLTPRQAETLALLTSYDAAGSAATTWDGHLAVVVGCGRSGTTWLERMLMSSPEAGGVDGAESFVFEQAAPLWGHLPGMGISSDHLVAGLRAFFDTVFAEALATHSPGARVFVEKTPRHALILPQLAAVYPDASFVHVVRDGRDVARSISQVDFFKLPDPADAARLWQTVLEQVRTASADLDRFREVRYEQLLAEPICRVVDLLHWLGVTIDTSVIEELERRAERRVSTHAGTSHAVGAPTWQALPPRELARVYAESGGLLVREGYATRGQLVRARCRPSYWSRALARRA